MKNSYNICILGIEGLGKTSYIKTAFSHLLNKSDFSIRHYNNKPIKNSHAYYHHTCSLYHKEEFVLILTANDYSGSCITNRDDSSVEYTNLKNDLKQADFLLIMIDGKFFSDNSKTSILKNIKRKCVRFINPLLAYCADEHSNDLPFAIFTITNSNAIPKMYSKQDISDIITESFNSVFSENNRSIILSIDIPNNIAVNIPMYLIIKQAIEKTANNFKTEIEQTNQIIQEKIEVNEAFLKKQDERLILKNPFKIKAVREENDRLNAQINLNNNTLSTNSIWLQKKLFQSILYDELVKYKENLISGLDVDSDLNEQFHFSLRHLAILLLIIGFIVMIFKIGFFKSILLGAIIYISVCVIKKLIK